MQITRGIPEATIWNTFNCVKASKISVGVWYCLSLKVSHPNTRLTPTQSTELEDVRGHVDVEDFDKCEIHVNGLQSHPGEWRQEEVVQGGRYSHAETVQTPGRQPGVDQKHQVQAQQRQGEVDEDLRGVVSTKLSETEMKQKVR